MEFRNAYTTLEIIDARTRAVAAEEGSDNGIMNFRDFEAVYCIPIDVGDFLRRCLRCTLQTDDGT